MRLKSSDTSYVCLITWVAYQVLFECPSTTKTPLSL